MREQCDQRVADGEREQTCHKDVEPDAFEEFQPVIMMHFVIFVVRLRTVLVRDFELDGVALVQGDEHALEAHKAEHGFERFGCAVGLVLVIPALRADPAHEIVRKRTWAR